MYYIRNILKFTRFIPVVNLYPKSVMLNKRMDSRWNIYKQFLCLSALQYGFVTMFVAAFPLAPLVAFVTNVLKLRTDAIKMIHNFRRPIAIQFSSIGVWHEILSTITMVSYKIAYCTEYTSQDIVGRWVSILICLTYEPRIISLLS